MSDERLVEFQLPEPMVLAAKAAAEKIDGYHAPDITLMRVTIENAIAAEMMKEMQRLLAAEQRREKRV